MFRIGLIITLTVFSLSGKSQMGQASIAFDKIPVSSKATISFTVNVETIGESTFKIVVVNPDSKKLSITIADKAGNILVDALTTEKNYTCKYNFSEVEDGKYYISISNKKEKFVQELELNTITTQSRNFSLN